MRRTVAEAVGILICYTTGDEVRGRMAELMEANTRKLARKAAQKAWRALKKAA